MLDFAPWFLYTTTGICGHWKTIPTGIGNLARSASAPTATPWRYGTIAPRRRGYSLDTTQPGKVFTVDHLPAARPADFIQPLPEGDAVLVGARSRTAVARGGETAEIRNADGEWLRSGHLDDAESNVLTTVAGDIYVGYFDEAAALERGLGGHGVFLAGSTGTTSRRVSAPPEPIDESASLK